jgi:hypothetical protein
MAKRVFVAGPLSKGDMMANVRAALLAANRLWAAGFAPYVPHLTFFWEIVFPHPYEDWIAYGLEMLSCCDYLVRLPGESAGADREESFARGHGIPVWYGVESFLAAMKEPGR